MKHTVISGFIFIMSILILTASSQEKLEITSNLISSALNKELHVGAQAESIEDFYKRHGARYAWNWISNRYDGIIDVSKFHSISIKIFVDDQRKFVRAEINDGYRMP